MSMTTTDGHSHLQAECFCFNSFKFINQSTAHLEIAAMLPDFKVKIQEG